MNPKDELESIQAELRTIRIKSEAAQRELTEAEMDTIELKAARATQLKAAINKGIATQEGLDKFLKSGGLPWDTHGINAWGDGTDSHGVKSAGYLDFSATAKSIAKHGIKALIDSGTDGIPIEFNPEPIRLGQPGSASLLSLLQATVRPSRKYDVLVQSVRTNNAAAVAPGGTKPVSTFTVKNVENVLQVIAHLSEPLDRFLLEDNEALERFVTGELENGVIRKAAQLAYTTFATTSGIQSIAYDGSAADTIFSGATAVQDLGYAPNLLILNSADYKAIRTSKDTTGNYFGGGPFLGADDIPQPVIWGLPTLVSPDVTAGSALVLDTGKVGVSVDRFGIRTDVDKSTNFAKNQVTFRTEGRFGFDVYTPAGIALLALTE